MAIVLWRESRSWQPGETPSHLCLGWPRVREQLSAPGGAGSWLEAVPARRHQVAHRMSDLLRGDFVSRMACSGCTTLGLDEIPPLRDAR
jgi:hypothetical protein